MEALACDRAATEPVLSKDSRSGLLSSASVCRSVVHTKLDINIVNFGEPSSNRLHKKERTGSGWKHSRQKFPRQTVVGWMPLVSRTRTVSRLRQPHTLPYLIYVYFFHLDNTYGRRNNMIIPSDILKANS